MRNVVVLEGGGMMRTLFTKLVMGRWRKGAVTISPGQLGYMLEGIDWLTSQMTERPELAG